MNAFRPSLTNGDCSFALSHTVISHNLMNVVVVTWLLHVYPLSRPRELSVREDTCASSCLASSHNTTS